jgi:hypothetical protein
MGWTAGPLSPLRIARPPLGVAPFQSRPPCPTLPKCGQRRRQGGSAAQSASGASTFLWSKKGPPGFPPQPRPKGPASLSTIDAATMRLCRADLPASRHPISARGKLLFLDSPPSGVPKLPESGPFRLTTIKFPRALSDPRERMKPADLTRSVGLPCMEVFR